MTLARQAGSKLDATAQTPVRNGLARLGGEAPLTLLDAWLGLGLLWLPVGMLVMPSSISYNPGRLYQSTLAVTLYLPALIVGLRARAAVWRQCWSVPAFRVFLLLLAWALLSLTWTGARHPGDEAGRVLSVLFYVLAWQGFAGRAPQRAERLLAVAALAMAACALGYGVAFLVQAPGGDGRIAARGVVATANYAAATMGAACVWLCQLPWRAKRWQTVRLVALAALLFFIVLTQSRGVWLALALCAVLTPCWRRADRSAWFIAAAVFAVMLVLLCRPLPVLTARGASLRPQLFAQALELIGRHPWLGLGQGAPFRLEVAGQPFTHSHNVLTQTAIELGLPGLVLLAALWLRVAWSGWRHRDEPLGRVVLGAWVYASVALQFDMPQLLTSPRPGWLLVWLPFGLALGLAAREPQDDSRTLLRP